MIYYKHLTMPSLIKDEAMEELFSAKYKQFHKYRIVLIDFKKYLTIESIDLFNSLGVFPNVLVLFGHVNNRFASNLNPIIHTDVMKQGNTFVKVPFAINYELTDTPATMTWFDTKSSPECYPEEPPSDKIDIEFLYASGINYGASKNRDASGYECLGSAELNTQHPILFRNNVPHCVSYPAGFASRLSASIRFPLEEIATFEQACSIFS